MEMVICFGSAPFLPSLRPSWLETTVTGLGACFGTASGLSVSGERDPCASSPSSQEQHLVLSLLMILDYGFLLTFRMLGIWLLRSGTVLEFGRMVAGRTIPPVVSRLPVLVFICLLPSWLWRVLFGVLRSLVMHVWIVVVLLCPCLDTSKRFSGVWGAMLALQAFWPWHLGIDNLNVVRSLGRLLDHGCLSNPYFW